MAGLSTENENLLKCSEVFVSMNKEGAGFLVSIPVGAKVTMSKVDNAFQLNTADPDGPQATMKAVLKSEIEQNPERAVHMQTVDGLDNPDTEVTIERQENGMRALVVGDARLSQGVHSITEEQIQQALEQNDPAQRAAFKPGGPGV